MISIFFIRFDSNSALSVVILSALTVPLSMIGGLRQKFSTHLFSLYYLFYGSIIIYL